MSRLEQEIALALWKVHILHHAAEGPVYGHWISEELRRHGYVISPGTLYPLLTRMEGQGWLSLQAPQAVAAKARRNYVLSAEGARALGTIRARVEELYRELRESSGAPVACQDSRPRRPAGGEAPSSSGRARPASRGGTAGGRSRRGHASRRKEAPE